MHHGGGEANADYDDNVDDHNEEEHGARGNDDDPGNHLLAVAAGNLKREGVAAATPFLFMPECSALSLPLLRLPRFPG
jgi:hypothetical protein